MIDIGGARDAGDVGFSLALRLRCLRYPPSSNDLFCVFFTAATVLEKVVLCMS